MTSMERPLSTSLRAAAGAVAILSAVMTPLLVFLGTVPEDAFRRLAGVDPLPELRARLFALLPDQGGWILVLLGGVSFAAGLLCVVYLAVAGLRRRIDRTAGVMGGEHAHLHDQIIRDYSELRAKVEELGTRRDGERDELLRRIETILKQVANIERIETERGEMMATVQKTLDRISAAEKREPPAPMPPRPAVSDKLADTARKTLDEIRRELTGKK